VTKNKSRDVSDRGFPVPLVEGTHRGFTARGVGRQGSSLCLSVPHKISFPELVFLNVYGAPESIPRNEFRQPM
jgi:hypothetical protein